MNKYEELTQARTLLSKVFNQSKEDWGGIWCEELSRTMGLLSLTIEKYCNPEKWEKIRKGFEG